MTRDAGAKRRWAAAAAGAAVVTLTMLAVARFAVPPSGPAVERTGGEMPGVEVAPIGGADRTLREATVMHDQTPLFLPTERNVALKPLPLLEAGGSFLEYDAEKLTFEQSELTLNLPAAVAVPEAPVEAVLGDAPPAPLYGLARTGAGIEPMPSRGALIHVVEARTNEAVLEESLPPAARPPVEKSWRPLEFTAAVDRSGLVGSLVVSERSDSEDVERYFRNYLAQTFRIGERLRPGFYRIIVGP